MSEIIAPLAYVVGAAVVYFLGSLLVAGMNWIARAWHPDGFDEEDQ